MYGIFSSFDETFIKYMRNHCQMKIFLFHHYPLENSYIKSLVQRNFCMYLPVEVGVTGMPCLYGSRYNIHTC